MQKNDKERSSLQFEETIKVASFKKNKFLIFWIISVLYIIGIFIQLTYNVDKAEKIDFDWRVVLIILTPPILGAIFHLVKVKIGWILNTFYYLLMTGLGVCMMLSTMINGDGLSLTRYNLLPSFMFLLSLSAALLLFSRSIRTLFNITKLLNAITISVSLILAIIVFILIQN